MVATELVKREIDTLPIRDWRQGAFLSRSDEEVLRSAAEDSRALFTYDVRTMPDIIRSLVERGERYAGVVLISWKTIPPTDVGGIVVALEQVAAEYADGLSRTVIFLRRPEDEPDHP